MRFDVGFDAGSSTFEAVEAEDFVGNELKVARGLKGNEFAEKGDDRVDLRLDPFFSREAAFLLDAMAASPRKWVSGGAQTPPCIHGRAAARSLWRRLCEHREGRRFGRAAWRRDTLKNDFAVHDFANPETPVASGISPIKS